MSKLKDFVRAKSPMRSKGVMGGAVVVALGVSEMIGFAVTPGDVVEVKEAVETLFTTIAGLLAIYGRITANSRISIGQTRG